MDQRFGVADQHQVAMKKKKPTKSSKPRRVSASDGTGGMEGCVTTCNHRRDTRCTFMSYFAVCICRCMSYDVLPGMNHICRFVLHMFYIYVCLTMYMIYVYLLYVW